MRDTKAERAGSGVAVDPRRVMAMRHIRRLSREQLAARIAALGYEDNWGRPVTLGKDALGKIETGQRKPSQLAFAALADALACDPVDLTPDGRRVEMPQWVLDKQERLEENRDLRMFAAEHGLRYVNPENGRVYYSDPLRAAFETGAALDAARQSGDYDAIKSATEKFRAALEQAPKAEGFQAAGADLLAS